MAGQFYCPGGWFGDEYGYVGEVAPVIGQLELDPCSIYCHKQLTTCLEISLCKFASA